MDGKTKHIRKLKSLYTLRYLLEHTDDERTVKAYEIAENFRADYDLPDSDSDIDRRSIYSDIETMNDVFDGYFFIETIRGAGLHLIYRPFTVDELHLIAESIYSARFISDTQSQSLVKRLGVLTSNRYAKELSHDVVLYNRERKTQNRTIHTIATIKKAMDTKDETGKRKKPSKISFRYLRYSAANLAQMRQEQSKKIYIVSPYYMIINDGYFYLLAYDGKKMATYRIDRMTNIEILADEPRDGAECFAATSGNIKNYAKQAFSMFGGELVRVQLRFINPLLDAAVDRFGTGAEVHYLPDDEEHFVVSTDVQLSDNFYSWVCSFGKKAKIVGPEKVVEGMKEYLRRLSEMYEDD